MTSCITSITAILIVCAAVTAHSGLLYYDGFPTSGADAYTVSAVKDKSNPQHASIVGFKDNAGNTWRAGSSAIRISANNLATPDDIKLTAQDGCFSVGEASGSPRAGYRNIVSPALSGTTYYSFLLKYKGAFSTAFNNDFVAFDTIGVSGTTSASIDRFGTNGFVVAFVRQDVDTVNLVLKTETATQNLVVGATAGTTYFVAAKYVNNPDAAHVVSASVITQPQEPETWTATITTPTRSQTINKMCIGGYGANSTANCFLFDEVRIGTTFEDIAGVAGVVPAVFSGSTTVDDIAIGAETASATLTCVLDDPGDPVADLYLYWGLLDGGIVEPMKWANTSFVAQAAATTFSTNVTSLPTNAMIHYRLAAVTSAQTVWGVPDPAAFLTAPLTVSSAGSVAENALSPASFTIARPDADIACTAPLKVNFSLGGTAQPGVHYIASSTDSVVIPASERSASVVIQPIPDFASMIDRSVVITVLPGAYAASSAATGSLVLLDAPLPNAPTNAFIGSVSERASNPANWSLGRAPSEADDILVSPEFGRRDLVWDTLATMSVGSWTQPAGNTNSVFFCTTPDAPLQIRGDADLGGGVWTHPGPSNAPVYAVAIDVNGNLKIGSAAAINVGRDIAGIDPAGGTRGFYRAGPGYLPGTGSSFGGEGFTNNVTYGSIVNPLSHGSGSRGGGGEAALRKYAGAGLIRIRVGGTLTVSGRIAADGYGYANNGGGGTGGTINLEADAIAGAGVISANGGSDAYFGPGSGGRIRLKLTGEADWPDGFTGTLTAFGAPGGAPGASAQYDTAGAAAGTIALQNAAMTEDEAIVLVHNHDSWRAMTNQVYQFNPSTHLPPRQDADPSLKKTDWVLGDSAKVRLTQNAMIRSCELRQPVSPDAVHPVLYLEGFTLSVQMLRVDDVLYPAGTYASENFTSGWVEGTGNVVVQSASTVLVVK